MVLSATAPEVAREVNVTSEVAPQRTGPLPANGQRCPRCDMRLVKGYDEPLCLSCGYTDYTHTPTNLHNKKQSLLSAATRHVLRYAGDFPNLADTLTHVKLIRVRNRVVYAVSCPFCDKAMDQSSLSGKRPDVREQRYRCMDGHRVSLVPRGESALGWK